MAILVVDTRKNAARIGVSGETKTVKKGTEMSAKQTFRIKLGSDPMYFSGIVDGVICWDVRKDAVVFSEYHAACDKINDLMEIGCSGDAYVHASGKHAE